MSALDRYWPLTRIRPAVEGGDEKTCTVILSGLIMLKSLVSFLLGFVVLFWLPIACLLVPSIITVHDPDDPKLVVWVRRVALLQITSHVLAAALGFAIVFHSIVTPTPVYDVVNSNVTLIAVILVLSAGFAIVAGKAEASGLMQRGI